MAMNRRNVLIGLGTVAAGGGAALGTGAFSSVEANREVSVTLAGDSAALLGLQVNDGNFNGLNDGGTSGTNGETTIDIDLSSINDDAVTTFSNALTIDNGGASSVSLSFNTDNLSGITFTPASSTLDGDDGASSGTDETDVDIKVDTTEDVSDGTLTIIAN